VINPSLARREVVRHVLKTFGIRASKRLGQNFLAAPDVVDSIVAAAGVGAGGAVLEIGPGIGTLTQALAEAGARVTAVEIDGRLVEALQKTLAGYDNIRIIHGDILKLDIGREISGRFTVVANLPYYITTPVVMRLLKMRLSIDRLVLMVQREVALRMVARPGSKDYGALSVAVQYHTEPQVAFSVPAGAFIPAPKVDSAVVRCEVRGRAAVEVGSEELFFRVVRLAFAQRRKTLANALKAGLGDREAVDKVLAAAGVDGMRRGETLSLAEFAAIANNWP